jgi:hypothetical protein
MKGEAPVNPCAPGGTWNSCGDNLQRRHDRDRRPAAEVISEGGGPVVRGDEAMVRELPGGMRKLGAWSNRVDEGRRWVFHGEPEAAAGGVRR